MIIRSVSDFPDNVILRVTKSSDDGQTFFKGELVYKTAPPIPGIAFVTYAAQLDEPDIRDSWFSGAEFEPVVERAPRS